MQDLVAYEDELIARGLKQSGSLQKLMEDLGITILCEAFSSGWWGHDQIDLEDLDRKVLRWLIGSHADREFFGLNTEFPETPSSATRWGWPIVTMKDGTQRQLTVIRFDRATERFLIDSELFRPPIVDAGDHRKMSIVQLRHNIVFPAKSATSA